MRYVEIPLATERIVSVDTLRGFDMLWILGADGAILALDGMMRQKGPLLSGIGSFLGTQFTHSPWEGFRFYDLIFPLFIFVTGVAIVLSLTRIVEREGSRRAHLRVMRRALLLYGLGLIYYGGINEHWADIRLMGVLQRIGLCYLFASLMFLNFDWRRLVAALVALLVGYWALFALYPLPPEIMNGKNKDEFTYPVAIYDHNEGQAVSGGFAYHGKIAALRGKFVFGDVQRGRLFAADLDAMKKADDGIPATVAPIEEIQLYVRGVSGMRDYVTLRDLAERTMGASLTRADLHVGISRDGEIFVTSRQDGMIRMLVPDDAP